MKILSLTVVLQLLLTVQPGIASRQQAPLLDHENSDLGTNYWKFNYSSSAPHYFASVYGLMQQWSNTFFPNGQSIAPCEIPAFTKLYHGRTDGDMPPSPEWFAFDIHMSYGIMGGNRNSHMLTYQTTQAVKCIYFDGESAALFGSGQLDSQMLHIFGNITGPPEDSGNGFRGLWQEYARAIGLCEWIEEKKLGGVGWGIEGIVRMNVGFEMIWCNFTSPSIRLVSHLNVSAPLLPATDDDEEDEWVKVANPTSYYPLPPSTTRVEKATDPADPPAPPNWRRDWGREPFFRTQTWNWFVSGVAHYGSSGGGSGLGETRVKISGCGFMNYYSPKFMSQAVARAEIEQKSLNLTNKGLWSGPGTNGTRFGGLTSLTRRRRAHTLEHVSTSDAGVMIKDSERVLLGLVDGSAQCSGMDWTVMTNEIVQNYAASLDSFFKTLQTFDALFKKNQTALRDWMIVAREVSHTFLLPFIQYPQDTQTQSVGDLYAPNSLLFNHTYSRCRFHHTRLLDPAEGLVLNPEEHALKWAVEETTGGICNVLVDVGLSIEGLWQSSFNIPINTTTDITAESMKLEVTRWTEGVEELMAWLGWAGEWAACDHKCGWNERCFIPMWPLINMRGGPGGRRPPGYGYGPPGYGRPGDGGPDFGPPWNGTGGGPPRGGFNWIQDETDLWQPRCVKPDYISL